jgi:hypothetical protein
MFDEITKHIVATSQFRMHTCSCAQKSMQPGIMLLILIFKLQTTHRPLPKHNINLIKSKFVCFRILKANKVAK